MTTKNLLMTAPAAGGGAFDPETDITWHSLFWAEGTDFTARSYANGASVTTWDNETGESDATATDGVTYVASFAGLNSQPVVSNDGNNCDMTTGAFAVAPSYAAGVSIVAVCYGGANLNFLFDGRAGGGRNALYGTGGGYAIFAGSTVSGGTLTDSAHFFVASFDGGVGTDTLSDNGTGVLSGSAGSGQLDGLNIFHWQSNSGNDWGGEIALLGIYEGDITAHAKFADFETWVSDHYGITIA